MQEGYSNTEATGYGEHTNPLMDPSILILSAATPNSCTTQSTEHRNTQVTDPSTNAILLNVETTQQITRSSPLVFSHINKSDGTSCLPYNAHSYSTVEPKTSRALHTNTLQRLPVSYQICAMEEDKCLVQPQQFYL
jgi:hypothetical protein